MSTTPVRPLAPWIKTHDRLVFERPYPGIRPRTVAPTILAGHWTGGEGGADRVFEALRTRTDADGKPSPLSVQFVIDPDAETWQFCDLDKVVCYHAGAINDRSLGVEIVNRGLAPALGRRYRDTIDDLTVHGKRVKQLAYSQAQLDAWCRLSDLVCSTYGIPRQVPGKPDGSISDAVMTRPERAAWRGVLEHLHVARTKTDGGTQLSRALVSHGYAAMPPSKLVGSVR